ncbi:hypothetical protein KIP88_02575 [Bradyrhizobium sp. SRL28]|uniref:hypothetical protein n=1 Tax=Bradyrhizobium sp. SRL28 TaxID=2836178 RepID=UPI001BDE63A8|nr:hypothetical protein [Bradyrhizobium sp. SRL28]MBT1509375.1 hypothetical protein [Bradyrhizobium sp. SRL28]
MSYQEYQEIPAFEQAIYKDGFVSNVEEGKLVWANKDGFQPPPVGSKVMVRINNLGVAEVKGYFSQEGYLGLLVVLDNAPEWYIKQNGDAKKVGHVFGPEVKALEAK